MSDCLYCEEEIIEAVGKRFCSSYCEQSWWMDATAGQEWERLENGSNHPPHRPQDHFRHYA